MSALVRKHVMLAGLGGYSTGLGLPADQIRAMVAKNSKEAAEHGFDCILLELNPNDGAGAREALKQKLQEKKWDGFAVGFGVRGVREHTALFEDALNAARELAPQARLMFPTHPEGLLEAIRRVFPEAFQ